MVRIVSQCFFSKVQNQGCILGDHRICLYTSPPQHATPPFPSMPNTPEPLMYGIWSPIPLHIHIHIYIYVYMYIYIHFFLCVCSGAVLFV